MAAPTYRVRVRTVCAATIVTCGMAALTACGGESAVDDAATPVVTTQQSPEQVTESATKSVTRSITETDAESATEDAPQESSTTAQADLHVAAGTVCGEVTSLSNGAPLSVVTMDDGLDCTEVMEVFDDYFSDAPTGGPPQGSGAFWEAPNGWICGGSNYLIPGDEDHKMNKFPSCGPLDSQNAVVAVEAERVSQLPV